MSKSRVDALAELYCNTVANHIISKHPEIEVDHAYVDSQTAKLSKALAAAIDERMQPLKDKIASLEARHQGRNDHMVHVR